MKKFKLKLEGKEILGKEQMRSLVGGYLQSCTGPSQLTCLPGQLAFKCTYPASMNPLCNGGPEWICAYSVPDTHYCAV